MHFLAYLLRRLILLIPVLIGITILTFMITHGVGDPIAPYVTEHTPIDQYPVIRHREGLDLPIWQQYFNYMFGWTRPNGARVNGLVFGDWGYSNTYGGDVTAAIGALFPATAELAIVSMIMALTMGIPLGIYSAVNKNSIGDNISRLISLGGVSMPVFWLGLMCIFLFFYLPSTLGLPNLPHRGRQRDLSDSPPAITGLLLIDSPLAIIDAIFPVTTIIFGIITGITCLIPILSGSLLPDFTASIGNFSAIIASFSNILNFDKALYWADIFFDAFIHIILPAFCLSYIYLAVIGRIMRSSMLEVLKQDYIILARSKGLSDRIVIYRHALRNAIIPTLTVAGMAFGGLLGGAVLTETVFSWPGLGRWAANTMITLDIQGIMGFVTLVSLIYVLSNLVVDLLYAAIDPRIRLG
ncbi:MAG: ABC transporter permease [Candidatus Hodarchaeales archaeon]